MTPLDRVVWWGPTDLAALDVGDGVTKLGAALAPINPGFTESEATTAIEYARTAPRTNLNTRMGNPLAEI